MLRLLLAFVLATPLFAQSADLSISAAPVGAVFHTQPAEVAIVVANSGPDRATNVVVTSVQAMDDRFDPRCQRVEAGFRCVADVLEPGTSTTFTARTGAYSSVRPMQFALSVRSDQSDPNAANNSYLLLIDWLDQSSGAVTVNAPAALDAQKRGTLHVSFENRSAYAATDAKLVVYVNNVSRLIAADPPLDCAAGIGEIVCRLPAVAPHSKLELAFEVELLLETRIFFRAGVEWGDLTWTADQIVTYYCDFDVTATADSGPGSLRQAIIDANALCVAPLECRIRFAIAEPRSLIPWYTIQPRTPLPELTGDLIVIDGRTQLDVYPDGPDVFLDGSLAGTDGPGLSFASSLRTGVYGLSIGNVRGNGISVRTGDEHVIRDNYLGVDPTGARAAANSGRGVEVLSGHALVQNNVLSGNGRSGAFLWCRSADVMNNRIGVAAHSDAPIGNGASGVFIGPRGAGYGPASVTGNVIANNRDFGVALAIYAMVVVERNRIFNNVQGGIDIGLDGPSVDAVPGSAVAPTPIIRSAYFDGTATIIEGIAYGASETNVVLTPQAVELYANTTVDGQGFAEGERLLGIVNFHGDGSSFTFHHEGDLRGLWITGVSRQVFSYYGGEYGTVASSEFSRPVKVE